MEQTKSIRVAIIGGSGFIGKNLVNVMENKHTDILVMDKEDIDLSLEQSIKELRLRIIANKIDVIIILAAVKRQDGDSKEIFHKNNKLTANISRAIQGLNCRIIYYSSCAVYGEKNEQMNVNEENQFQPTSFYGEHKIISEEIYKNKMNNENLLIIRPPLIYDWHYKGGYQPGGFLASAQSTGEIFLWGDGREKREFIHVEDAAEVTKSLIERNCCGDVIMASGVSYSYRSIAKNIQSINHCKIFEKERTGHKVDHSYSNRKLMSMIGDFCFRRPFVEKEKKEFA